MSEWAPDVVGLSVMTFQRRTAHRLIRLVRSLRPGVRVVVGGYDPSLAPDAYTDPAHGADFIVRGEGEVTFRELLRAIEAGAGYGHILRVVVPRRRRVRPHTGSAAGQPRRGRHSPAAASGARPRRLHRARPGRRRDRDLTWLHVRLQLLLDHRDARPKLLRVPHRARDRRHPRRAGARGSLDLLRRRQHRARRPAVRGALPGDHRGGAGRRRLHGAGHDVDARESRRDAGAADAPRGVSLRLSRDRERAR